MFRRLIDNKDRAIEVVKSLNSKYIRSTERLNNAFIVEMETITYVFEFDDKSILEELERIVDSEDKIIEIKTIQLLMSNYDVFKLFKDLKKKIEFSFFEGVNENCELNEFSVDDVIKYLINKENKSAFEKYILRKLIDEKYDTVIFYQ